MDCPTPPPDTPLVEVVAALREAGADTVQVSVRGPGAGEVRRALPGLPVHRDPDPGGAVADLAARTLDLPGRCVIVARRTDAGWDFAVAGVVPPYPPPPPPPPSPTLAPPAPSPRRAGPLLDHQVANGALTGGLIGALGGLGAGLVVTELMLAGPHGPDDGDGGLVAFIPLGGIIGVPVGVLVGGGVAIASRGDED